MVVCRNAALALGLLGVLLGCGEKEVTASEVETRVFTLSCVFSSCHAALPRPQAGLLLEAPVHDRIVNVASTEKPSKMLIAPGDPDGSFLLDKLLNRDIPTMSPDGNEVWEAMPPGGLPLEDERIDLVRSWIEQGAPP